MTDPQEPAGTAPTTAELIRSTCIRAPALLAVAGAEPVAAPVRHLLPDGSVAVAAAAEIATAVTGTGEQAVLELTDHAPLPLRARVRALVWIRGQLQRVPPQEIGDLLDRIAAEDPNPALLQVYSPRSETDVWRSGASYRLLRLATESVVMADATGAEAVAVDELLRARPDPFCAIEAGWLRHLDSSHPEVVAQLTAKLPLRLQRGRIRPLGVDRYGIRLRIESAGGDHQDDQDVRLPFHQQVDDVAGLNRAVRVLMGCPFLNGLQARRS